MNMKTWTVRIGAILLAASLAVLANSCMPFNPIGAAGVGDLKIYWVIGNTVQSAALDGTGQQTIHTQTGAAPVLQRIVVDKINGKIYWSDTSNSQLWWSNLDGTGAALIISGYAFPGLAIDAIGGKLYVVRQGAMRELVSYDLDGKNPTIIYFSIGSVVDLKLDLANRYVYYTDGVGIFRGPMTAGSNAVAIYPTGSTIKGIALDIPKNMIYFSDGTSIYKSSISGTLTPQLAASTMPDGAGDLELDPYTGILYFAVSGAMGTIKKVSTSGGAVSPLVTAGPAISIPDIFLDLWP